MSPRPRLRISAQNNDNQRPADFRYHGHGTEYLLSENSERSLEALPRAIVESALKMRDGRASLLHLQTGTSCEYS